VSELVAGLEWKNGWTLAEQAGELSPDGMQRLLRRVDEVRDDVRAYAIERLGDVGGVLIADETGFIKKGSQLAGVQRRYSGNRGPNRELSGRGVPGLRLDAWACADRPRAVPPAVLDGGPGPLPGGGHTRGDGVHQQAQAGPGHDQPGPGGPSECPLPGSPPMRPTGSAGAHGPRKYHRARVAVRPGWERGRGHWLLARRSLADPVLRLLRAPPVQHRGPGLAAGTSRSASSRPRAKSG
jgi:hypothetical protein